MGKMKDVVTDHMETQRLWPRKSMRVTTSDGQTFHTIAMGVDLRDCIPDPDEFYRALAELETTGRYWIGGGAAPLVYISRDVP